MKLTRRALVVLILVKGNKCRHTGHAVNNEGSYDSRLRAEHYGRSMRP